MELKGNDLFLPIFGFLMKWISMDFLMGWLRLIDFLFLIFLVLFVVGRLLHQNLRIRQQGSVEEG